MKLTILKGIANDFVHYLDSQIRFGYFKDLSLPIDITVLEKKDSLSKLGVAFFKERLPSSFDFKRIEKINLQASKSNISNFLKIVVFITVDKKEFSVQGGSIMNES